MRGPSRALGRVRGSTNMRKVEPGSSALEEENLFDAPGAECATPLDDKADGKEAIIAGAVGGVDDAVAVKIAGHPCPRHGQTFFQLSDRIDREFDSAWLRAGGLQSGRLEPGTGCREGAFGVVVGKRVETTEELVERDCFHSGGFGSQGGPCEGKLAIGLGGCPARLERFHDRNSD